MTWTPITTEAAFRTVFADRTFTIDGNRFTIHSDGRITGSFDGVALRGEWYWQNGMFCRTAYLGDEDLGLDRETIEASDGLMHYRGDDGRADARTAEIVA